MKDDIFVTPNQLADRCGVTERQIRFDMSDGMPHVRLPILIPLERAVRWREDNRNRKRTRFNAYPDGGE